MNVAVILLMTRAKFTIRTLLALVLIGAIPFSLDDRTESSLRAFKDRLADNPSACLKTKTGIRNWKVSIPKFMDRTTLLDRLKLTRRIHVTYTLSCQSSPAVSIKIKPRRAEFLVSLFSVEKIEDVDSWQEVMEALKNVKSVPNQSITDDPNCDGDSTDEVRGNVFDDD